MAHAPTPLDAPETFRRRARYVVALVTVTAVGLFVLWTTRQAILLVFLGVAIGALFFAMSQWLAEKTGAPRGAMLALVVLAVLGALAAAVGLGGPLVVDQAQALSDQGPELIEMARDRLGLPDSALSVPSALQNVGARLLGFFSTAAGVLSGLLVVLVVAVYTAADPGRYTSAAVRLFDHEHQAFIRNMLDQMAGTLVAWLKGTGIAVLLLGAMAAIGLSVIGVPGALALAVFAGLMTIIPTFGPFIGWAPAVLVAFANGTTTGAWTLGLALVAQQIEGSFITPKVQGSMVRVAPAFIVAGQIVLGGLAGFLGILLVVPILGVGLILVQHLYIGPFVEGEPADPENPPPVDAPADAPALQTPAEAVADEPPEWGRLPDAPAAVQPVHPAS